MNVATLQSGVCVVLPGLFQSSKKRTVVFAKDITSFTFSIHFRHPKIFLLCFVDFIMILIVCSCLNVQIHGKGTSCVLEDASCLDIPENVSQDSFFESQIYRISLDLAGITMSQKMLCKVRNIENWSVTTCSCCMMDVFAKKQDNEEMVIVSSKAETSSTFITSSMNSERYSPLFKLLLPEINDNFIQNNIGIEFHNRNVDLSIELVQNQVSNYLKEEQKAMEEKIRQFTEQQQGMYTNLLQKVRKNKQAMIYLMIQCNEGQIPIENETSLESSVGSPPLLKSANESSASTDSAFDRSDASELPFSETISQLNHRPLRRAMSIPAQYNKKEKIELRHAPVSIDIGGVFDMEDFDLEIPLSENSDNDNNSYDSENDQPIEVVDKRRSEQPCCASSLPMTIPTFPRFTRSVLEEDEDDIKDPNPMNPEDIAASMRALACSTMLKIQELDRWCCLGYSYGENYKVYQNFTCKQERCFTFLKLKFKAATESGEIVRRHIGQIIKRVPTSSDPALDLEVLPDSHPAVPAVVQEELVALPSEQPPVITTPQSPSVI
ncbi:hypothetical protein JTE90_026430 [Oedothorax gibbosus]|uniref:Uncharacterized protein n=1 Tax=Oedothorax gibbosus TaxID=931172 RepID=A0AAV6VRM0_9ARAC|nr:hypothetical protein JTE90_026430 [Oedothorax gibbosus]